MTKRLVLISVLTCCMVIAAIIFVAHHEESAHAAHAAKLGSRAVGYYTCKGKQYFNPSGCSSCTYKDPVYGLNVCSNWDLCKTCLKNGCNASCTTKDKKGKTKKVACVVHMTGQSVKCFQ